MKLSEVKAGDMIYTDMGFTCMKPTSHIVQEDDLGLFIECNSGNHYLNCDINGELVGISKEPFND